MDAEIRDMDDIVLASTDALGHGCTRDMDVIIVASMDEFDHGEARRTRTLLSRPAWMLSTMDALRT